MLSQLLQPPTEKACGVRQCRAMGRAVCPTFLTTNFSCPSSQPRQKVSLESVSAHLSLTALWLLGSCCLASYAMMTFSISVSRKRSYSSNAGFYSNILPCSKYSTRS